MMRKMKDDEEDEGTRKMMRKRKDDEGEKYGRRRQILSSFTRYPNT